MIISISLIISISMIVSISVIVSIFMIVRISMVVSISMITSSGRSRCRGCAAAAPRLPLLQTLMIMLMLTILLMLTIMLMLMIMLMGGGDHADVGDLFQADDLVQKACEIGKYAQKRSNINQAADSTMNQISKNAARWWFSLVYSFSVALVRDVPGIHYDIDPGSILICL